MSQSAPPQMGGQEEGPNPLEIFFEKNKKWIIVFAVALITATGLKYGLDEMNAAERNDEWAAFNDSAGLSASYAEKIAPQLMGGQGMERFADQFRAMEVSERHSQMVSALMEDLEGADQSAIDQKIQETQGKPEQAWLIWVAANKAYAEARFDDARGLANRLKKDSPKHLLCSESKFPPQVLKEKDKDKKKGDDEAEDDDEPEYEDPRSGVPVDHLLAAIDRDEKFRQANPGFFAGPAPDGKETMVLKIADLGEIEIGFYASAAKSHVAEFKKNLAAKLYDGMRVHLIKRAAKGKEDNSPVTVHLGHPNSKDTDRLKWKETVEAKDEDIIDFEETKLSFFPGMVAAEQEQDGKSSARRFFLAVNDCAPTHDGEYVIFGKVIRGMEILKEISEGDFLSETEDDRGEGTPARDLLVESATLKTK